MCGAEDGGDVVGQGESDVMVGEEGGGHAVCRTLRGVSGCISWEAVAYTANGPNLVKSH